MKSKHFLLLTLAFLNFLIMSCNKDLEYNNAIELRSTETPEVKPNILPYLPNSIKYVRGYVSSKSGSYTGKGLDQTTIAGDWYVNVTLDSSDISPSWYATVVKDSLVSFYDFDISSPTLAAYSPDVDGTFNLNAFKDGKLHASLPMSTYNTYFKDKVNHIVRDTLLMVTDTTQEKELLVYSGFISPLSLSFLKPEAPEGHIRYDDPDQGGTPGGGFNSGGIENRAVGCSPVIRIKVWAIKFGIPVTAYTNNEGWFRIPTGFLFGTLIGTEAINKKIAVKPLSLDNIGNIGMTILEWIFGPKYNDGWYRKKNLDEIDICFNEHNKYRWWAMIITASSLNRNYMAQDGILLSDKLTAWAMWRKPGANGAMSCPMFGLSSGTVDILDFLQQIIPDLPNININMESHFMGFLPDIIFSTQSDANNRPHYTSRIFHTMLHELGHYTHYKQVGKEWWTSLVWAETTHGNHCGGYPAPNTADGDIAQIAECWAEYMGDRHACRYYDPRRAHKVMFDGFVHPFIETRANGTTFNYQDGERFNNCEYHAYGIFFDLTDNPSVEPTEAFDNIGGFTFQQLYFFLSFKDRSMCQYIGNRIAPICIQNGTFNQLFQMVDHLTLPNGQQRGHFLNCWQ